MSFPVTGSHSTAWYTMYCMCPTRPDIFTFHETKHLIARSLCSPFSWWQYYFHLITWHTVRKYIASVRALARVCVYVCARTLVCCSRFMLFYLVIFSLLLFVLCRGILAKDKNIICSTLMTTSGYTCTGLINFEAQNKAKDTRGGKR